MTEPTQRFRDLLACAAPSVDGPGRAVGRPRAHVRWHGKNFRSALAAQPLMCVGEDGELYSNLKAGGDDTLMGIMNGKLESAFGIADLYYFWLEREA